MIKVAVFARLTEQQLDRIRAVDPRLDVHYVGDTYCVQENRVFLAASHEETSSQLQPILEDAEVILGYPGKFSPDYPLSKLKWVQALGAGLNHLFETTMWKSDAVVTNASGVHVIAMSEHAIMCALMLTSNAPRLLRQQAEHKWERWHRPTLNGHSIGILGAGAIGTEVARLANAFGMTVRALDASYPSHHLSTGVIHEVFPVNQLEAMLSRSDYVVNCLPLTPATTHLLNDKTLAVMPKGSFVISLSRGPIIDHAALKRALDSGHLGGAALDVTEPEPLPADSPLWDMPNVIITPHISGIFINYMDRLVDLFSKNLEIYLQGGPLLNVFNKELGY